MSYLFRSFVFICIICIAQNLYAKDLSPLKRVEILNLTTLTQSAHGSDGSDRARDGKPRFSGPLGAQGVSYKGYQYVVYYSGKDRSLPQEEASGDVIIARRKLPNGPWERSTLQGYKLTSDDAHNRQTIAISKADGVIHISFDHHNGDTLNYARTGIGAADNPEDVIWDNSVFTYQANLGANLLPKGTQVTYPKFKDFPDGGLILYFRNGGSYGGDMRVARYDANTSKWIDIRNVSTRHGSYNGANVTRGPYLAEGMQVGSDGSLYAAWVFRERPCEIDSKDIHYEFFCNHGLYFAKSPDNGASWYHANGRLIANTLKGESISVENAGPEVVNIPKSLAPSNVLNASTVDDKTGNMHVLIKHLKSQGDNQHKVFHYIGTPEGQWSGKTSNFSASDARLVFHGDYLLAFEGRASARIFYAKRSDSFKKWKEIEWTGKTKAQKITIEGGFSTWDLSQLDDGLATLMWHTAPESGRNGDPSPIHVVDIQVLK